MSHSSNPLTHASLDTPENQETSSHAEARAEVHLAEKKVAWGIKYLYLNAKQALEEKRASFDSQGIATYTPESKELNIDVDSPFGHCKLGSLFPNGLTNGVTIHLFEKDYIRHPPALYMIQQKIRSLCQAASRAPYHLSETAKLAIKIEEVLQNEFRAKMKNNDARIVTEFSEIVRALMDKYSQITAKNLYARYSTNSLPNPESFSEFANHLLKNSTHYRSDTHDILTFDNNTGNFSYDEAAHVTAHDRTLGSGCANLSLIFEGHYQERAGAPATVAENVLTQVTSSSVKHASPVAISSIPKFIIGKSTDTDLLVDTYRNLVDVIKTLVRLRVHGRQASERNKPISIDWVYQMLTTNALDIDKQSTAYGYVARAARLLNQSKIEIDGIPIRLAIGVMNAGINKLADVGTSKLARLLTPLAKASTQRRENRHAYLQLSNATRYLILNAKELSEKADNQTILSQTFQQLKTLLSPMIVQDDSDSELGRAQKQLASIEKETAQNSINFNEIMRQLQPFETKKIEILHQLNELKTNAVPDTKTKKAMLLELQNEIDAIDNNSAYIRLKEVVNKCDQEATKNYNDKVKASDIIVEAEREKWAKGCNAINGKIEKFRQYFATEENRNEIAERLQNPATAEQTTQQILAITALIYKTYANELYYGDGKDKYAELYRDPEKAALFNAYLISFQRLAGMMATFGCKSANDRTFVIRLLDAALAAQPLDKQALPAPLHMDSLTTMPLNDMLDHMVMTNSALFSAINDTSGGAPKVSGKKFQSLAAVTNLDLIGDFGKDAGHKKKFDKQASSRPGLVTLTGSGSKAPLFAHSAKTKNPAEGQAASTNTPSRLRETKK